MPRVVGTVVLIAAILPLVSARLAPFSLIAVLVALAALVGRDRDIWPDLSHPLAGKGLAAFLCYAAISALWAPAPLETLSKTCLAAVFGSAAWIGYRVVASTPRRRLVRSAEGLSIGFAIALIYMLLELLSHQATKIWLLNTLAIDPGMLQPERDYHWVNGQLVSVGITALTRNTTPITVFLWPALMATLSLLAPRWNKTAATALYLLAAATVWCSPHETSKLAIVTSTVAFSAAIWSPVWTRRAIATAWITACLGVVPLAMLAHRYDLHNASWLQNSAQHRIIIWNFTAEQAMKSPLIGHGAYMTYVLGPSITAQTEKGSDEKWERKMSRHAHNVYLQTWFELGAVGAVMLMIAGLAILRRLRDLPASVYPFGCATLTAAITMMGASYGMWQAWYMALFALSVVLFAIGARCYAQPKETSTLQRSS